MSRQGRGDPQGTLTGPVVPFGGTPGLQVFLQTETDVSGGPPGQNTTDTITRYVDGSGNGWQVGMNGSYGGALVEEVEEIDANVVSAAEVTESTSVADGFIHVLAQSAGAVFSGSEDPTYTLVQLAPYGTNVRRYWDSGTVTPSSGPALNYRVRTMVQPGDPGFLFHRIDITNPSGSAVSLAASDSLEIAMIGGLSQALQGGVNAWQPANGLYANVGGTETAWPASLTTANPDYIYITPQSGAGLSLTPFAIKKTGLVEAAGVTSGQIEYLQNASRLKMKLQGTLASFPASTTFTLYYLQGFRRSVAAGEINSIAADYLNPDGAGAFSVGTFSSYSYDEGCYVVAAASNEIAVTHTLTGSVTKRWLPMWKATSYTSISLPTVSLAGTALVSGTDYLAYVDTVNQIAYVKLLKQLVASGAGAGQLNNGLLTIASPVVATGFTATAVSTVASGLAENVATGPTVAAASQVALAMSLASVTGGSIDAPSQVVSGVSLTAATGFSASGLSAASFGLSLAVATGSSAQGISSATSGSTLAVGTSATSTAQSTALSGTTLASATGFAAAGVSSATSALTVATANSFGFTAFGLSAVIFGTALTVRTGPTSSAAATATSAVSLSVATGGAVAAVGSVNAGTQLTAGTGTTAQGISSAALGTLLAVSTGMTSSGVSSVASALTTGALGSFGFTAGGISSATAGLLLLAATGSTAQGVSNASSALALAVVLGFTANAVSAASIAAGPAGTPQDVVFSVRQAPPGWTVGLVP